MLSEISIPEANEIKQYFDLTKRIGQLAEGKEAWLKHVKPDGRIHGRVNPNGACTGRMSHSKPNVAQADKKDPRMRALFKARKGWKLVGCDAEGIEARVMSHYLWRYDDGAFAKKTLEGDKKLRTDVHSANLRSLIDNKCLLDCFWNEHFARGRDCGKTGLYALIYGAANPKLGKTMIDACRDVNVNPPTMNESALGARVRAAYMRSIVGLEELTKLVQVTSKKRGYLIGLDGRHLPVRSLHSALNTLFQGGGAIIMKLALILFWEKYKDTHGKTWGLCANVHDEIQLECEPELAEEMGKEMAQCIVQAGIDLKVRCPLAGSYDIGENWSQTH
jgi:DNA polymerase-1